MTDTLGERLVANGTERQAARRGRIRRATALCVAAVATAAAVAVAILVRRGRFAHLDQHALSHWTPWLQPPQHHGSLHTLLAPDTRSTVWGTLVALAPYPASTVVSAVIVLAVAIVLWRRGRRRASVVLCDIWIAANVAELAGKHLVTRPRLHQTSYGHHGYLPGLQHSLPSGHVIRALVVAAALAALGRAGRLAYVWALAVPAAVVATGGHTPTDAAAGLAAGIALVAVWRAVAD